MSAQLAPAASIPDALLHKNRLQEYTQRASIPLPIYQTINEGYQHAPKFRSTVWVDGSVYKSANTYPHRKSAEQDAAKVALECISKKIKAERCPLISEDTVFCKSILNEYAAKAKIEMPVYYTVQSGSLLPVFVSSSVFNGVTYTGEAGRNKKEAEQLAARAVIQSILGTGSGMLLTEIIRSKGKLYAALPKVVCGGVNVAQSSDAVHGGVGTGNSLVAMGVSTGNSLAAMSLSGKGKQVVDICEGTNNNPAATKVIDAFAGQVHNVVPVMPPAPLALPTSQRVMEPTLGAVVPTPLAAAGPSFLFPEPNTVGRKRNRKKNKKRSQKRQRLGEPE